MCLRNIQNFLWQSQVSISFAQRNLFNLRWQNQLSWHFLVGFAAQLKVSNLQWQRNSNRSLFCLLQKRLYLVCLHNEKTIALARCFFVLFAAFSIASDLWFRFNKSQIVLDFPIYRFYCEPIFEDFDAFLTRIDHTVTVEPSQLIIRTKSNARQRRCPTPRAICNLHFCQKFMVVIYRKLESRGNWLCF